MKFLPVILILFIASPISAQPLITTADLDSLNLRYSLSDFLNYLNSKLRRDDPLLRERSLAIVKAYYGFQTVKQELKILNIERNNLKAIYNLHLQKQKSAQISDLEVLQSHNALLAKELTILSKTAEARNYIIEIVRLCNLRIEYNGKKAAKDSVSKRD